MNQFKKINFLVLVCVILTAGFLIYYFYLLNTEPQNEQEKFSVIFNLNYEDLILSTETVNENELVVEPIDPEREGYTFEGWFLTTEGTGEAFNFETEIISNLTLYAKWLEIQEEQYTVIFNLNYEDLILSTETVNENELVVEPVNPNREGYIFEGWFLASEGTGETFNFETEITSNLILYAKWLEIQEEQYSQNLNYYYNTELNGYEVSLGDCTDLEVIIPSKYDDGINGESNIVGIIDNAFENSNITSVYIPNTIISILDFAFEDILTLSSVIFEENSQLTLIGDSAFQGCTALTTFTIPETVTTIMENGFKFTSIEEIIIPASVTTFGDGVFQGCEDLTTITFEGDDLALGSGTFVQCSNLSSVTLPTSLTTITDGAFALCTNLTGITIPSTVTTIQPMAFGMCGLTSIEIPSSVTSINLATFMGCAGLTNVTLPSTLTSIGNQVFSGCTSLQEIIIPASVTSIGSEVFSNTSITLPIAQDPFVFNACTSLQTVIFEEGSLLEIINNSLFKNCTSLNEITIPNNITTIGELAFSNCTNLNINIFTNTPAIIGSNAFGSELDNSEVLSIKVFPSYLSSYQTNWSIYSSKISALGQNLNYVYNSNAGGTNIPGYTVAYGSSTETEIIILSLWDDGINGIQPVLAFGAGGFSNSNITTIFIPNTVIKTFSTAGFEFLNCYNLESINIANDNPKYLSIDGVMFIEEDGLSLYAFPCARSGEYEFPSNVNRINVFYDCINVTSLIIPSSVTSINASFMDCSSLTSIIVDENNPNYSSFDGILFNKDKTRLCCFPCDKNIENYEIPNTVTIISNYAFHNNKHLINITIPNSVTNIGVLGIGNCINLESIKIFAETPPTIGSNAFGNVANLSEIFSIDVIPDYIDRYITAYSDYVDFISTIQSEGLSYVFNSELSGYDVSLGECTDTDIFIPNMANDGINGEANIVGISISAFENSNINSIWIPNTVTIIGDSAFQHCANLTKFIIPSGITIIEEDTFKYCSSLSDITIPDGVTTIGQSAFLGCSSLTSLELPFSLITIGYASFVNCTGLLNLSIPSSVTTIENSAFGFCSSLFDISLQEGLTTIGDMAFGGTAISSIQIPNSITTLSNGLFIGCSNLTFVTLPITLTTIGNQVFSGCVNLQEITIPASVTSLGTEVFTGCSITLPISPEPFNFNACTSLYNVVFENGSNLLEISYCAFKDCIMLSNINIPDSVTTIGSNAFYYCSSLTEIIIPNSVTTIRDLAFYHCSNLQSITILASIPPTLTNSNVFNETNNCLIYIPNGTLTDYQNATNWASISSRFVEMEEVI